MWHGGGWSAGGPYLLFPHAEALAAAGYLCLVPTYPLATPERVVLTDLFLPGCDSVAARFSPVDERRFKQKAPFETLEAA